MSERPPRETVPWQDWELDTLEKYHALFGTAYVQRELATRGSQRGCYSVRHKASRLGLSHAMHEMTSAVDVAAEAGVSLQAVHQWVKARDLKSRCRYWGRELLLPAPMVALYLHDRRVDGRPPGWWGSARAAEYAGVHVDTLRRDCDHVVHGRTAYFRPEDVQDYAARLARLQVPPAYVCLRDLTGPGGPRQNAERWLKANGTPARQFGKGGCRAALYVHEDAARQFLTARGHHEEQVETLLRRALMKRQG